MKKVFALLAISGMAAFYACSSGENQEQTQEATTTEATTTETTTTEAAPATPDSSAQQAAPADSAKPAEGSH